MEEQLKAFGCGLEVTLLSAIPAGSGLGTSSILAATMLGAVNDFCGLGWDKQEIGNRTLVLEQLLTTGGGWQDQYGGILPGIKLLQTESGWKQSPMVRWLPEHLFTDSEYRKCHLLYYTGLTRTAKGILAEIVKGMFLNSTEHLELLRQMKQHALDMHDAIQRNSYEEMARLVGVSWKQNQALDSGTNPPAVQAVIDRIADLSGCHRPHRRPVLWIQAAGSRRRRISVHGGQRRRSGGPYPQNPEREPTQRQGPFRGDGTFGKRTGSEQKLIFNE